MTDLRFPARIAPIFDIIGVTSLALVFLFLFTNWQHAQQDAARERYLRGMETFFVQCMAGKWLVVDKTEAVRCIRI